MLKTSLPPVRVSADLRTAAEGVLRPDETLSSLMAYALRAEVRRRLDVEEYVRRGLIAKAESERDGSWSSADDVLADLQSIVDGAHAPAAGQ